MRPVNIHLIFFVSRRIGVSWRKSPWMEECPGEMALKTESHISIQQMHQEHHFCKELQEGSHSQDKVGMPVSMPCPSLHQTHHCWYSFYSPLSSLLVVAMHKGFQLFQGYFWAQSPVCGNAPGLTARMARFIAHSSVTLICWPVAETSALTLPCGTEGMNKASFISFTAIKGLSI